MKRTIIAIFCTLAAAGAGAQTMYDGLTFSQNNYYGTARSIGMGNAMTAVGGDLGSIGINPAGSAVYNFSQFTITPNLTISSMNSSYSAYPTGGQDHFINSQARNLTRFTMPNVGATLNMPTGNRSGLLSVTFGFLVNGTNNFTGQMMAGGANDKTSYLSAMAVGADGFDIDVMNGYMDLSGKDIDQWDYAYYNTDIPWNSIVNAQAGSIANYGDVNDPDYYWRYIAATEGFQQTEGVDADGNHIYDIYLAGPVNQAYGRKVTGSKYDALFNVGFNINNRLYLGANLGLANISYDYDEYFKEAAQDPADFLIEYSDASTYWSDYRSRYSYSAEGSGVYGKFGFIAIPADGVRIGAAIQTPTVMNVNEIWRHAVDVNYTDVKYNANASSPEGEFAYRLITPYRVNAGVAFTFMGMGMLSADYEMTDYSAMKFRNDVDWNTNFDNLNSEIRDCMGKSHMVRLGAEFKPMPEFAVRAGYNFTTIPEYEYNGTIKTTLKDRMDSFSVGIGYYSKGSFFADLAARLTMMSDEYISPYIDYLSDVASPLILNKRERYDITATFGWRF